MLFFWASKSKKKPQCYLVSNSQVGSLISQGTVLLASPCADVMQGMSVVWKLIQGDLDAVSWSFFSNCCCCCGGGAGSSAVNVFWVVPGVPEGLSFLFVSIDPTRNPPAWCAEAVRSKSWFNEDWLVIDLAAVFVCGVKMQNDVMEINGAWCFDWQPSAFFHTQAEDGIRGSI